MPKDCSSEYVVLTSGDCDSSISSYIAVTDNSCDSSYDLIRCKSGCETSSSKYHCFSDCRTSDTSHYSSCDSYGSCGSDCKSSSSCSDSSSSYCKCSDSDCSSSYSSSVPCRRHDPYYRDGPVIQRNTIITTLPPRPEDEVARVSETDMALPPSSITHPRNRSFRSVITPLGRLKTPFSQDGGANGVAFTMRRRNDVVNLQHEPFSGELGAKGVNHLEVTQSIGDLPPHPVDIPHRYRLNGVDRIGFIRIDPLDASSNLKFYFDADPRFTTDIGDTVEIPGNSISWITSY